MNRLIWESVLSRVKWNWGVKNRTGRLRFPPDVSSDAGWRRTSLQVSLQPQVRGGHVWTGESLCTSEPLQCHTVRWPLTSARHSSAARPWPPDRSWSPRTTRWATRWPGPARLTSGRTAAAPTPCPEPEKPDCPTCCCAWSRPYTGVGGGSCRQRPDNQPLLYFSLGRLQTKFESFAELFGQDVCCHFIEPNEDLQYLLVGLRSQQGTLFAGSNNYKH